MAEQPQLNPASPPTPGSKACAAATRAHVKKTWQPMTSAPHDRLILLKSAINGGNWPMVGKWSHVHGSFYTPGVAGLNEVALYASAWADIPKYDDSPFYNADDGS